MKKFWLLPICIAVCVGVFLFIEFHATGEGLVASGAPELQAGFQSPICARPAGFQRASLSSLMAAEPSMAADVAGPEQKNVSPLRSIWEPGPNFSGLFVDTVHDEILVIDNGRNAVYAYSRVANGITPPLRTIKGPSSAVDFPASIFVDTAKNEIYVVDNEITDMVQVFSRTAHGDPKALRKISVRPPDSDKRYYNGVIHAFGLWGDPARQEFITTAQIGNNIATWDMQAGLSGVPKRNIRGPNTGLANPLGASIDSAHNEVIVVQDGSKPGSQEPPSLRFYNRDADGDVAPLRVIQGPSTKLEYAPKGLFLDTVNDEVYIATSNNAILVFPRTGSGNVAPARVLTGALTNLDHPTGVYVDTNHNEMMVSNWENFSITVYPRTANGNVAPIRTIRASGNDRAVGILRGRANTFDRVNDEIWHLN